MKRLGLGLLLLLASACGKTGVLLTVDVAAGTTLSAMDRLEVLLTVGGTAAPVQTLSEKGGGAIALPTSAVFLIEGRTGDATLEVVGRQGVIEIARTQVTTKIESGKIARARAVFGGAPEPDDLGADARVDQAIDAGDTDGGDVDLATFDPDLATAPALTPMPTDVSFPTTVNGQTSATLFLTIRNSGTAQTGTLVAATLGGTNSTHFAIQSDGCMGLQLSQNATCQIGLQFAPTMAGDLMATVHVSDGTLQLDVTLTGKSLVPGTLVFGGDVAFADTAVGATSTQPIQLTNTGGAESGTITLELSGGAAGQFAIPSGTDGCSGATLMPSLSCTATLEFKPTGSTGGTRSTTILATATPGGPALAMLSGKATTPALLEIIATPSASFNFGVVDVGTPRTLTYTVRNTGTLASGNLSHNLPLSGFSITGGSCVFGAPLAGETSCTIDVRFDPAAFGLKAADLSVGGAATPALASLSGVGKQTFRLTVTKSNPPGNGSAASDPAGEIDLPAAQSSVFKDYDATTSAPSVVVVATPDSISSFTGWTGCTTVGPPDRCTVVMNAAKTITATFVPGYTVTINPSGLSGATGSITSTNGAGSPDINCGATCSRKFPVGTSVTIVVSPAGGFYMRPWGSGPCATAPDPYACSFTVNSNTTLSVVFTPPNRSFVTSGTVGVPNVSTGSDDADGYCQTVAAGLGGTWFAWLGDGSHPNVKSKFTGSRGWARLDGRPWADDLSQNFIVAGSTVRFYYPPELDQSQNPHINEKFWTGTQDGMFNGSSTCWGPAPATGDTYNGWTSAGNGGFEYNTLAQAYCPIPPSDFHLLCLEKGFEAVVRPPPVTAPHKFVFSTGDRGVFFSITASTTRATADGICAAEATTRGLPGTYKAALTDGTSIASRFAYRDDTTMQIVRDDGITIANAKDFFDLVNWLAPAARSANFHLLGAKTLRGAATNECKGTSAWGSTAATAEVFLATWKHGLSTGSTYFYTAGCGMASILCLQE